MTSNQFSSSSVLTNRIETSYIKKGIWLKRAFDIFFSSIVLFFGFPLFIILAILIKCTSEGPIFYTSFRLGCKGRLFKFWKFRSMHCNAESLLKKLLKENPELDKEWQKCFKLKNDPRLTRIGKLIRKISFDEIPQFWNVLKGDLSIVGPRPYLPHEEHRIKEIIGNNIDILLSVKPGITGIWQTSGRSSLSFQKRLELDLNYIQIHSFLLDMQLIAKTVPEIIASKGAF